MFPVEVHTQVILSPYRPVRSLNGGGEKLWSHSASYTVFEVPMEYREQTLFLPLGKWFLFCEFLRWRFLSFLDFCCCFFPPKGNLHTQQYVSLFTSLHVCSLWPEEWYYCETWNLSFSERDSGQSPCASASPWMAWTSASKTDMLVRPECLHSWAVCGDSTGVGGAGVESVSLCPAASCNPEKP